MRDLEPHDLYSSSISQNIDTMLVFMNIEMSRDSMVYTNNRISFNLENKRKHSTCDVILFFENKEISSH